MKMTIEDDDEQIATATTTQTAEQQNPTNGTCPNCEKYDALRYCEGCSAQVCLDCWEEHHADLTSDEQIATDVDEVLASDDLARRLEEGERLRKLWCDHCDGFGYIEHKGRHTCGHCEGSGLSRRALNERKHQRSAMFCAHANEVPARCPCEGDCYCKSHTCKPRPQFGSARGLIQGIEAVNEPTLVHAEGIKPIPTFTIAVIREKLFDVIDDGWREEWMSVKAAWLFWHDESDEQTEMRMRFVDEVVRRLRRTERST